MKIGIDARLFGPKWGGGGLGRYVEELISGLQQINTKHRFVVFLKPENFDACKITNKQFKKVKVNAHWYTAKEQILMPKAIKRAKVDLMHFPHWNIPIRSKTPFIVTIHDLILLEEPTSAKATTLGSVRYAIKRAGFHSVLHRAVNRSKKIIAVSEYTKNSILNHFKKIQANKISVIYEGVTELNSKFDIRNSTFELPETYFLYVGSAYPHKNLESLLHAFSFFVKEHPEVKLILAGKTDKFYKALKKEINEISIPDGSVVFTGFVPDSLLKKMYRHAALYMYPSRIEGFGLPPLEAMLQGAPVAAARSSSLPEVLGNAAIYFDPDNIEQMVEVMEKAISDESLLKGLKKKGAEQIKKYSWQNMAKETMKIYEDIG